MGNVEHTANELLNSYETRDLHSQASTKLTESQYSQATGIQVNSTRFGPISVITCANGSKVMRISLNYDNVGHFLKDYGGLVRWNKKDICHCLSLFDFDIRPTNIEYTKYLINLYLEYPTVVLADELQLRRKENRPMKADELIQLIGDIASGLLDMQMKNVVYGDVRPENVCLVHELQSKKIEYKLMPLIRVPPKENSGVLFFPDQSYMREQNPSFLHTSPLVFEAYCRGQTPIAHNVYKSDVFSLAVLALEMGTLVKVDSLYDRQNSRLKEREFVNTIQQFSSLHGDYKGISDIVARMMTTDEDSRIDLSTLVHICKNPQAATYGGQGSRMFAVSGQYIDSLSNIHIGQQNMASCAMGNQVQSFDKANSVSNKTDAELVTNEQIPNLISVSLKEAKLQGRPIQQNTQNSVTRDEIEELSLMNTNLIQALRTNQGVPDSNLLKLLGMNQTLVNKILLKYAGLNHTSSILQADPRLPPTSIVQKSMIDQLRSAEPMQDYHVQNGPVLDSTLRQSRRLERGSLMNNISAFEADGTMHRSAYIELDKENARHGFRGIL